MSEGEYHTHSVGLTDAIKMLNSREVTSGLLVWTPSSLRVSMRLDSERRRHRSLCRARYFETRFVYSLIYGAFKARYQKVYRDLRDGHLERVPHLDSLFPVGESSHSGLGHGSVGMSHSSLDCSPNRSRRDHEAPPRGLNTLIINILS